MKRFATDSERSAYRAQVQSLWRAGHCGVEIAVARSDITAPLVKPSGLCFVHAQIFCAQERRFVAWQKVLPN